MDTHHRARRATLVLAAVFALIWITPVSATTLRAYRVTITNLTSGQAFTPPVVATHEGDVDVFSVGQAASFGVKEIAENGYLTPLVSALRATSGVSEVFEGTAPLVPAGTPGAELPPNPPNFSASVTFDIHAASGARFLSFVSMLICTNDGFTGVDRLRLPNRLGESLTIVGAGYDAGTERNTEDFADIVPPCQGLIGVSSGEPGTGTSNGALAEGGVIHHHPGIVGGADLLPAVHGWMNPVVSVSVERIG